MATIYSDAGNEIPLATTYTESLKQQWATFNNAGYEELSEFWNNFIMCYPLNVITVVRPPPI